VAAAGYLAAPWFLGWAGRFLDVSEPPRRADYVFVLGGGPETRPFAAAALLRAGLARRALFATVKLSPEAEDGLWPADHEVTRRVLLARGVRPADIVIFPEECDSTEDEARVLACFLEAEPEATVTVVTSDYHTRRTRLLFRRALGPQQGRVHFVAAPVDGVDAGNWWRTEKGLVVYVNEYFKLARNSLR
jgi:uncharacterized SAM-binding protein YcdF (DUF218 family)